MRSGSAVQTAAWRFERGPMAFKTFTSERRRWEEFFRTFPSSRTMFVSPLNRLFKSFREVLGFFSNLRTPKQHLRFLMGASPRPAQAVEALSLMDLRRSRRGWGALHEAKGRSDAPSSSTKASRKRRWWNRRGSPTTRSAPRLHLHRAPLSPDSYKVRAPTRRSRPSPESGSTPELTSRIAGQHPQSMLRAESTESGGRKTIFSAFRRRARSRRATSP